MSQTTLIANGTVVTADGEFAGDVLIDGEKIAAVGHVAVPDGAEVVDAAGCFVLPGLIDNHTHLSMPFMGTMSSDDYDTGTQAAAAGGVTCLVDFAIQNQPDNLQSTLDEWRGRADGAAHVDYGFHMAITNASEPVLEDMTAMSEAGVCSFKLFMAYKGALMVRDDELAACMERARDLDALTMVHAENGDIIDLLVRRSLARGDTSAIHHALTRPEFVEAEATGRAARIAEHVGAPLFVVHVTCGAAAAEIDAARASRAAATSALRRCATRRTTDCCGATCSVASSRASRPTIARSTTSRSRAVWTTSASCRMGSPRSNTVSRSCGTRAS